MSVRFISVSVVGFNSIRSHTESLDGRGIVAIKGINKHTNGSNGAGKTSLIESIVWCIYGQTLRPSDSVGDVVNQSTGYVHVELRLQVGDQKVLLFRYRNHPSLGTGSKILIGHEDRTPKGADANTSYGDLIGFPFRVFQAAVLFGTSTPRFASGFSDADKKSVIQSVIGLDFNKDLLKTKQLHDQLAHKVQGVVDHLRVLDTQKQSTQESLQLAEKEAAESEGVLHARLQEYELTLASLKSQQVEECKRLDILNPKLDLLQERKRTSWNEFIKAKEKFSACSSDVQRKDQEIEKLRSSIECPLCKRKYENSDALASMIAELVADVVTHRGLLQSLKSQVDLTESATEDASRAWAAIESAVRRTSSTVSVLEQRINDIKSRRDEVKDSLAHPKHTELIQRLRTSYQSIQEQTDALKEELGGMTALMQYLEFWISGFGKDGLTADALEQILPEINNRIQEYIHILSDGKIEAKLILKGTKIVVRATGENAGSTYGRMSDGERRRVDLAIYFANHDAASIRSGGTNVLFIDEGADAIDSVGVSKYLELLRFKLRTTSTIYVVAHNSAISDAIQDVLVATKENGFTSFTMERHEIPLMEG